jgi:CTP synthase (UTP-ammonia lyase)
MMSRSFRVALIGDYNPEVTAHRAIPKALELAAASLHRNVEPVWCHTAQLSDVPKQLSAFDAVWCVPASPYANMDAALAAIRHARENNIPYLGTCGGFQHAIIEYARNVRGIAAADHAESNPNATVPLISPLTCSLVEASEELIVAKNSAMHRAYGALTITESYRCSYGLNPDFAHALFDTNLVPVAHDSSGQVRAVELPANGFFVATLFQPERCALKGEVPPLVRTFVEAIAQADRATAHC